MEGEGDLLNKFRKELQTTYRLKSKSIKTKYRHGQQWEGKYSWQQQSTYRKLFVQQNYLSIHYLVMMILKQMPAADSAQMSAIHSAECLGTTAQYALSRSDRVKESKLTCKNKLQFHCIWHSNVVCELRIYILQQIFNWKKQKRSTDKRSTVCLWVR